MAAALKRSELLARILIMAAVLGAAGIPLFFRARTPLIHAKVAENGGWSPAVIQAEAGLPLHLRLTSDDVVHSFAVGRMDMPSVDVLPGKVTEITLNFSRPGTYTFYCTRWCGLNHWRMRGKIEVAGPGPGSAPAPEPLYVTLGLDLDAPHNVPMIPAARPSAISGQDLAANFPVPQFSRPDYYRAHSPYQVFENLNSTSLSDPEKWDLVAYIWEANTTAESLANGEQVYARNCAACHGEKGAGDGVFAAEVKAANESSMQNMPGANSLNMQGPVDFTDPERMLGASPALLQGKILRGGMGTGMPMWGSILTDEQIWDLVAYLYSFQFEYR